MNLKAMNSWNIPSQIPIENVNFKVPDLESKQRFSEDNPRIRSGQLSEHLKCPKTIEFRPILFLKLSSVKLQNQFRWFGHVQKISKPAWALWSNNFKTGSLVEF